MTLSNLRAVPEIFRDGRLPKKVRRGLLTTSKNEQKCFVYFDANALSRLLQATHGSNDWIEFGTRFGGSRIQGRRFNTIITVLQLQELMGLKTANPLSVIRSVAVNRDAASAYQSALELSRKFYSGCEEISEEVIEDGFKRLETTLPKSDVSLALQSYLAVPHISQGRSRASAYRSTLIEHLAFQFVQISEIYGDALFRQVMPSIFFSSMMNRAEGSDIAIYRAIRKDVQIFRRMVLKKNDLTPKERMYFNSLNPSTFKDHGDHVDSELIHYAIAGSHVFGGSRVLCVTLDPKIDQTRERLRFARGHYDYIMTKTRERYPEFAKELCPGYVLSLDQNLRVTDYVDVEKDISSWMDAPISDEAKAVGE